MTRGLVVLAATALAVGMPTPASAHGIGGDVADLGVLGFLGLGVEHMLLGWDHLLFVAGVLLIARGGRRAARLISVFVLGHSTTLILATLAGWRVDAAAVDLVIGLSVVLVGALGMVYRSVKWRPFTALVLGFGLVHGLGLATRLQDLGLPEDGVLWRVIAFNLGIEIGQLTAIVATLVLAMLVEALAVRAPAERVRRLTAAAVFAGGMAATTAVAIQTYVDNPDPAQVANAGSCVVEERTTPLPAVGGHVQQSFYSPTETAPLGDFGHSVGDGYVAILYPPDLPADQVAALRSFVEGERGRGLLAGADVQVGAEVHALTAESQLTCAGLDLEALERFTTRWFASF